MRGLIFIIFLLGLINLLFCGYSMFTNNFFNYFMSLFIFLILVISTMIYSNYLYPNTRENENELIDNEMKTK